MRVSPTSTGGVNQSNVSLPSDGKAACIAAKRKRLLRPRGRPANLSFSQWFVTQTGPAWTTQSCSRRSMTQPSSGVVPVSGGIL